MKRLVVRSPRIWLAGLIALLVAVNLAAAFVDKTPMMFDAAGVFRAADYFARGLTEGGGSWDLYLQEGKKPWLVSMIAGVPLAVLGRFGDPDVTLIAEQLFFALLLVGVYASVGRVSSDDRIALLAALVTGVSPGVFGMSKALMHDVPLAAAIWCAVAALMRTDRFRSARMSLLFGALCGVGLMVKQTFAVFMFVPVAIAVVAAVRDRRSPKPMIAGMLFAAEAAFVVAGPWYVKNFAASYAANAGANPLPGGAGDLVLSARYLLWIADPHMGWVLAVCAGAAAIRLLARAPLRSKYGRWLAAGAAFAVVPYVFVTSIGIPLPRYMLAWVPVFAAVLAAGLIDSGRGESEPVDAPRWSRPAIALVVFWGLFQFGYMSLTSRPWHDPRTPAERLMAFPGADSYPGGLHAGVFRINRQGVDGRMICMHLRPVLPADPRMLVLTATGRDDLPEQVRRECVPDGASFAIETVDIPKGRFAKTPAYWEAVRRANVVVTRRARFATPGEIRADLSLPPSFRFLIDALNADGHVAVFARTGENWREQLGIVVPEADDSSPR